MIDLMPGGMLKAIILLTMVLSNPCAAFGIGPGTTLVSLQGALSDTSDTLASRISSRPKHWLNIDLMLGRQYLAEQWEPYSSETFLALSCQRRLNESPLWLDGSFYVAWAGELDAEGYRAGSGTSLVQLHSGLSHWWYQEHFPLSFYAGAGITYIWAKLTLPDRSVQPQFNPAFPDRPIYPDMSQEGHFWGGYGRCGIVFHFEEQWYIGIGLLAKFTTNRTLLGKNLSINSTALGLLVGAGE